MINVMMKRINVHIQHAIGKQKKKEAEENHILTCLSVCESQFSFVLCNFRGQLLMMLHTQFDFSFGFLL